MERSYYAFRRQRSINNKKQTVKLPNQLINFFSKFLCELGGMICPEGVASLLIQSLLFENESAVSVKVQ